MIFRINNKPFINQLLESKKYNKQIKSIKFDIQDKDSFLSDVFDNMDLIFGASWVEAVSESLIVNEKDDSETKARAKSIVELMSPEERSIQNLKILDFGCGDGKTSQELLEKQASKVIGFDIQESKKWESKDNLIYTTDYKLVQENAPYDFILGYNVLDYVEKPEQTLRNLGEMLNNHGSISLRMFPWIGRFGGDLHKQINKAFIHLVFPENILKEKGYDIPFKNKVIHPIMTYRNWIKYANLEIIKEEKDMQEVEKFFLDNFQSVFYDHYKKSPVEDFRTRKGDLSKVLSFRYIDYFLKAKN